MVVGFKKFRNVFSSQQGMTVGLLKSPYGPMDKAPAYGAGDSGFESQYGLFFRQAVLECNWLAPKVLILVIRVQIPVEPFFILSPRIAQLVERETVAACN